MGTQGTFIVSLFPLSGDHCKIPELEDHLDARLKLSLSGHSQQKYRGRRISDASIATRTHSA